MVPGRGADVSDRVGTTRGRGRPHARVLTRDRITDSAMSRVSTHDYRSLTMSALAKDLGVSASALYNHVSSKRDVLILIQERLNAQIDCSGFGMEAWDLALKRWAHSYRERFIHHTALIPTVAVLPVADSPETLRMYETVASGLQGAGFAEADVVDIIVGVESLIFGAAYDASSPADIFDPGADAEAAPTFARLASSRSGDARAAAGRAFSLTLDALVEGLRGRLSIGPAVRA